MYSTSRIWRGQRFRTLVSALRILSDGEWYSLDRYTGRYLLLPMSSINRVICDYCTYISSLSEFTRIVSQLQYPIHNKLYSTKTIQIRCSQKCGRSSSVMSLTTHTHATLSSASLSSSLFSVERKKICCLLLLFATRYLRKH